VSFLYRIILKNALMLDLQGRRKSVRKSSIRARVDKFGWQANSSVIFIALGLIFILTIYLVLNDRKILKRESALSQNIKS